MNTIHDVTINGSLYGVGVGLDNAERYAIKVSLSYPNRLVRVHDVDGIGVLSEFRNGERVQS
jgi:hypothetical protein